MVSNELTIGVVIKRSPGAGDRNDRSVDDPITPANGAGLVLRHGPIVSAPQIADDLDGNAKCGPAG